MELPEKIAFVDTETTGGNCKNDRIIEIGIIRVEHGKVVNTWQSLLDPGHHIPPEIIKITGINQAELDKAPTFRNVFEQVEELLDGCVFAAHNARFDYSFIKSEFLRVGKKITYKQLCTVKLSRQLYPQYRRHSLDELAGRFNIRIENRHRALDDARATYDFYQKALAEIGAEKFQQTISEILLHPSTPGKIKRSVLDKLPEKTGVYIFYGDSGMPLYVGKSINIKERVLSHLTSSLQSARELRLTQEVAHIEVEVTSGELGALIREAALVKKLQPLHNRQLRQTQTLFFLSSGLMDNYKTMNIVEGETPPENCFGIYRTSKQAQDALLQKVKLHNLCEKLLGLEKIRKTCFKSDLGICSACTGIEDPLVYNLRFDLAFANERMPSWPFSGAIAVHEEETSHLFNNWCYLGPVKDGTGIDHEVKFDLDTYKILRRFLRQSENMGRIRSIVQPEPNQIESDYA